jgi:hypothetical protein
MAQNSADGCLSSGIALQLHNLNTAEKVEGVNGDYEQNVILLYEIYSKRCHQKDPSSIDSGIDLTADVASYIPQSVLDNTKDFMTRFDADEVCTDTQVGDLEICQPLTKSDAITRDHGMFDFEDEQDEDSERNYTEMQTLGLHIPLRRSKAIPVTARYGSNSSMSSASSTRLLSESEQSFLGSENNSTEFDRLDGSEEARSVVQDQLADFLLNGFLALPMLSSKSVRSYTGYSASSSTSSWSHTSSNASSQTSYSNSSGSAKRPRPGDDGEGDSRRSRKTRLGTGRKETELKLLACPFAKFDAARYSEQNLVEKHYRGCSSSFLKDISRLKQHLYRVHRLPEYHCLSCYDVFDTRTELEAHSRRRPACEVCPTKFAERMTAEQMQQIKRKQPGSTVNETWYNIYSILFPGSTQPASPYAETRLPTETLQRFLNYVEDEGPALLSELLHTELADTLMLDRERQAVLEVALETAMSRLVDRLTPGLRQIANTSTSPEAELRRIPETIETFQDNPYKDLPDLAEISMDFDATDMMFDIEAPEQLGAMISYKHDLAPQIHNPLDMKSTTLPTAVTRVSPAFASRPRQCWLDDQDSFL